MKPFRKTFHFLGSVKFAILLISLTILFVAAGTFLEARTESHLFSSSLTYSNPLFLALIWGFFINILFSALRRWPFQYKHIPFLTTHLGLLMLLGGVIIKSYWGTQGSMSLIEGGSNSRLYVPNTFVVHVEKRDPNNSLQKIELDIPLKQIIKQKAKFDDVDIHMVDYGQHSSERFQSWIKGNDLTLSGLGIFNVGQYDKKDFQPMQAKLHHETSTPWKILATRATNIQEASKQFYVQETRIEISNLDGTLAKEISLEEALREPIQVANSTLEFSLEWPFSSVDGLEKPRLIATIDHVQMSIALSGPDSLLNKNASNFSLGKLPFNIDLKKDPLLLFFQDENNDDYLFAFNPHGEIHSKVFNHNSLQSVIVYDQGFGGYALQTPLNFSNVSCCRHDKEQAELFRLAVSLRNHFNDKKQLATPLALLKDASDRSQQDFIESFLLFLSSWDKNPTILHASADGKLQNILEKVDWNRLSLREQYACSWLCTVLEQMDDQMNNGKSFHEILIDEGWPLAHQFGDSSQLNTDQMLSLFAQQLFAASDQLPEPNMMPSMMTSKALSAYLLALGITLNNIRQPIESHQVVKNYHAARLFNDSVRKVLSPLDKLPENKLALLINNMPQDSRLLAEIRNAYIHFQKQTNNDINFNPQPQEIANTLIHYAPLEHQRLHSNESEKLHKDLLAKDVVLETPLTLSQNKMPAFQKWEDNHPLITLEFTKNNKKEYFTLTYDKFGTGLSWPILGGEYLTRFQPLFIEIPHSIRLHEARQINYPDSNQPYSYEADIIVTDKHNKSRTEKTISMNNVHETNDGYRFYLSNITPNENAAKRVQIVVNRDPAKYFLTYPGALILCLGIILLFWLPRLRALDRDKGP